MEKLEIILKKQYFEKNALFKKVSLLKWKGTKYAGGSRPSCS